ncbi:hypothetical protein ACHAW6_015545 [Cyclotella cf. meneghiniana]
MELSALERHKEDEDRSKSKQENVSSRSRASSSSGIDDLDFIDPDAVDFEPLLVSGTGKILSYHNTSFYNCEDVENESCSESSSVSIATPITSNVTVQGNRIEEWLSRRKSMRYRSRLTAVIPTITFPSSWRLDVHSCPFSLSQMIRGGILVLALTCLSFGVLYSGLPSIQFQAHILKATNNIIADTGNDESFRHMMNIDIALKFVTTSRVVLWLPTFYTSTSAEMTELLVVVVRVMPLCFSRSVFYYQMDVKPGLGSILLDSLRQHPTQQYLTKDNEPLPEVIITPFFRNAATKLFDDSHQGIFLTIVSNPIYSYAMDHSFSTDSSRTNNVVKSDNMLVRHLAGITDEKGAVDEWDFYHAKNMLRTRFFLLSCDDPMESLRRLSYFRRDNFSKHVIGRSGSCLKEQFRFEKECKKIYTAQQQLSTYDTEALAVIKSKHSYDMLLFDYSEKLFVEQKLLFNSD